MMNAMTRTLTEPIHVSTTALDDDGNVVAVEVDLPAGDVPDDTHPAVLAAVDDFIAAHTPPEPDETPTPARRRR